MKTVGVLTMHRVLNYGSILQTWALQRVLEKLGYNVYIIDYLFPNIYHKNESQIKLSFPIHLIRFLKNIVLGFPQKHKYTLFEQFINDNLKLSDFYEDRDSLERNFPIYDIYVAGSDQIWNPKYIKDDTAYFLDFAPRNKKLISYASSFAQNSLSDKFIRLISPFLKRFDAISVREENGQNLILKMLNSKVPVCLDPTLLLSSSDYKILEKQSTLEIPEKYILVYVLNYAYNPYPYVTKFIKAAYKQLRLPVVCLDFSLRQHLGLKHIINLHDSVGPNDFVKLFLHASLVITTSFHGTAFSINFNKSVYSIVDRKKGDDRMRNLLSMCGIPERAIEIGVAFPSFSLDIDYCKINNNLSSWRNKSINYLKNNL